MNRLHLVGSISTIVLVAALFAALATAADAAALMGTSGGHDLDELWSRAQRQFDLTTEDAVLLLESRKVSIEANGNLRTRVHRVVWVGANVSIRPYADLRIPHNSATSTLTVNALRTWRDEQWWPAEGVSESAVVETLPFAIAGADDYSTMRETMLLHDGVGLPCIMETDYEIVERGAAAYGTDGLWIFTQSDPAVRVELVLDVSQGESVIHRSGNGAPEPAVTTGANGRDVLVWAMENVERIGSPRIDDPAVAEPYVAWSTWRDWTTLGNMITRSFDDAAVPGPAMSDTLAARLEHEHTAAARARTIAGLVDEFARGIHYDSRFWRFAPRTAERTWETAYGHGLDRAVLAAALFRGAGFDAVPVYRSSDMTAIDLDVPGLTRFGGVGVRVMGEALVGYYDPEHGNFTEGPGPFRGATIWQPGANSPGIAEPVPLNRLELALNVEPGDGGAWTGHGFINADGLFCPYNSMVGFDGEALAYIDQVASSIIEGADADAFNPEMFSATRVTGGFGFDVAAVEPDSRGRTVLTINSPVGGIATRLPSDVHLYSERRTSPVVLPGPMTQRVTLRIKVGDRAIDQLPEARAIENNAGSYSLRATHKDGWITLERELVLNSTVIPPEHWPDLRGLLLAAEDAAGRTLYLK